MLSEVELTQAFVEASLQGKEALLANHNLLAQRVFDSNQLISKTEGVILSAKLTESPTEFLMKVNSDYWVVLNQVLATHGFLSASETPSRGFYPYRHFTIPSGYQLNCDSARGLWRTWWKYRRHAAHTVLPLHLLIRMRHTWYPIRDIMCGNGLIFVQTLGSEVHVHIDDLVCWLNKVATSEQLHSPQASPAISLEPDTCS